MKLKACRSYCPVTLSVSAKINYNIIWGLDHPFQRSQSQPTTCFMRACQLRPWSVTPYLTPAPSAALPPACEDTYFNDPKQSKALGNPPVQGKFLHAKAGIISVLWICNFLRYIYDMFLIIALFSGLGLFEQTWRKGFNWVNSKNTGVIWAN